MLGQVVQFATSNPDDAMQMAQQSARSAGRIAGHALGMTASEINAIAANGVPRSAIAIACLALGAAIAMRYAPDPWIQKVRRFGR